MHPLALRLSVLAIILAATSKKIGRIIPEPYLVRIQALIGDCQIANGSFTLQDEVFHIPQAQAYCRNAFDVWDPKLTTPAGLYILSYPLRFFDACSPQFLRGINAFGIAYALPVVVYLIWQTLHEEGSALDGIASQVAMNVALFPVLYFFGGLYYTDVWSTIFVMAAYLATLRMKPWVAGVFAWISLWFRQTNIVWVAFMAGVYAVCRVAELEEEHTGKSAAEEQKKPDTKENENPGWLKEVKLHDPNISGNIKSIGKSLVDIKFDNSNKFIRLCSNSPLNPRRCTTISSFPPGLNDPLHSRTPLLRRLPSQQQLHHRPRRCHSSPSLNPHSPTPLLHRRHNLLLLPALPPSCSPDDPSPPLSHHYHLTRRYVLRCLLQHRPPPIPNG